MIKIAFTPELATGTVIDQIAEILRAPKRFMDDLAVQDFLASAMGHVLVRDYVLTSKWEDAAGVCTLLMQAGETNDNPLLTSNCFTVAAHFTNDDADARALIDQALELDPSNRLASLVSRLLNIGLNLRKPVSCPNLRESVLEQISNVRHLPVRLSMP